MVLAPRNDVDGDIITCAVEYRELQGVTVEHEEAARSEID